MSLNEPLPPELEAKAQKLAGQRYAAPGPTPPPGADLLGEQFRHGQGAADRARTVSAAGSAGTSAHARAAEQRGLERR
jgi:hypothetical protein